MGFTKELGLNLCTGMDLNGNENQLFWSTHNRPNFPLNLGVKELKQCPLLANCTKYLFNNTSFKRLAQMMAYMSCDSAIMNKVTWYF